MLGVTTRPVPPNILTGRQSALAVAGSRRLLNLTLRELASKAKRTVVPGDPNLSKRTFWDYQVMPWINKEGTTTELFVFPKGAKIADRSALWRISMAPVIKDGPFSPMEGYTRIITVIEGDGFIINGGEELEVRQGTVLTFSGGKKTNCRLINGSCLDLNIVFRGEKVKAGLELAWFVSMGEQITLAPSAKETIIIICLSGKIRIAGRSQETLRKYESAVITSENGLGQLFRLKAAQPGSEYALVRITEKG